MGHNIDLSKYEIRTDLAIDVIDKTTNGIISEIRNYEDIKVTDVKVDEEGSKLINKKVGNYITLEFIDVTDTENKAKVRTVFSKELKQLLNRLNIVDQDKILIVGLGNSKSTPDALGPLTINNILITNHLFTLGEVTEGFKRTMAITPGVMANTGIETSDIIKSIIKKTHPSLVIAIDALSSQTVERLNKTIQMTDTGIHPGSGVGNSRKELSKSTLGIPVIAIGVPTVVDAATIVTDTINYMYKHFSYIKQNIDNPLNKLITNQGINYLNKKVEINKEDKEKLFGVIGSLSNNEIKQLMFEVLSPIGYNLMVTPKEVDFMIEKLADIIGNGINMAIHEKFQLT